MFCLLVRLTLLLDPDYILSSGAEETRGVRGEVVNEAFGAHAVYVLTVTTGQAKQRKDRPCQQTSMTTNYEIFLFFVPAQLCVVPSLSRCAFDSLCTLTVGYFSRMRALNDYARWVRG